MHGVLVIKSFYISYIDVVQCIKGYVIFREPEIKYVTLCAFGYVSSALLLMQLATSIKKYWCLRTYEGHGKRNWVYQQQVSVAVFFAQQPICSPDLEL